jgi:hypothetical protein
MASQSEGLQQLVAFFQLRAGMHADVVRLAPKHAGPAAPTPKPAPQLHPAPAPKPPAPSPHGAHAAGGFQRF